MLHGHGHVVAKGMDLKKFMAEIFGRKNGFCMGRSGSMHLADASLGILGANGIVGGGIPIATGAAFAAKYQKSGKVAVAYFGDGATSEGNFHECMNMAALWKLPVVFVVINNQWAISTPRREQSAASTLAQKAIAAGFDGEQVDGNDIIAVAATVHDALLRARCGEGPHLVECLTYRLADHTTADDARR